MIASEEEAVLLKATKFIEGKFPASIRLLLGDRVQFDVREVVETPTPWSFTLPVRFDGKNAYLKVVNSRLVHPEDIREEFETARHLAKTGLAPRLLHEDIRHGILIMEAVRHSGASNPLLLAAELRRFHRAELRFAARRSDHRIDETLRYMQMCLRDLRYRSVFATSFEVLKSEKELRSKGDRFCHGDLNPTNVLVKDDRAYFIDFDFCGLGNPDFDLATLSLWLCRTNEHLVDFISTYDERQCSDRRLAGIHEFRRFVLARYACMTLWLARDSSLPDGYPWNGETLQPFHLSEQLNDKSVAILKLAVSFANATTSYMTQI